MRKAPHTLTAGAINKELDALDAASSENCTLMIAAGRGLEKPTETLTKNDPLSIRFRAVFARRSELRIEVDLRFGSGAPSRLPTRGFGPRKL